MGIFGWCLFLDGIFGRHMDGMETVGSWDTQIIIPPFAFVVFFGFSVFLVEIFAYSFLRYIYFFLLRFGTF